MTIYERMKDLSDQGITISISTCFYPVKGIIVRLTLETKKRSYSYQELISYDSIVGSTLDVVDMHIERMAYTLMAEVAL